MRRLVVIEACQLLKGVCCAYYAGSTFVVNASTLYRNTVTVTEISQKPVTLSSNLHYPIRVRHLIKTIQIRCITLNINHTDGIYICIYIYNISSSFVGVTTHYGF